MSGARTVGGRNLVGMRHGVKGVLTPGGFQNIWSMCAAYSVCRRGYQSIVLGWVPDSLRTYAVNQNWVYTTYINSDAPDYPWGISETLSKCATLWTSRPDSGPRFLPWRATIANSTIAAALNQTVVRNHPLGDSTLLIPSTRGSKSPLARVSQWESYWTQTVSFIQSIQFLSINILVKLNRQ